MAFRSIETPLPDLLIIEHDVFRDPRGYFLELFNQQGFENIGLGKLRFVQDNLSYSVQGTLRGMHFQKPPYAQGKLVKPLQGAVYDAVVDLRRTSPTYGQWYGLELHADDPRMLYVPPGFAHGFQVLSESCLFFYKCTQFYNKAADSGIRWDDPALGIEWRDISPLLSEKDLLHPVLADFDSPF
ncbi:MAG: dTDP-4-dehydrorhamnose 3,5-epimerase [Bacteroidia bacterium]|nr:dTDP-4-dehydrorhamnose 3,5-epimerase [Bacteroidia bacterium]